MNQPNSSDQRATSESHAVPDLASEQPPAAIVGPPPVGEPPSPAVAGREPEPARWELAVLWLFIAGMALATVFVGYWLWLKCQ